MRRRSRSDLVPLSDCNDVVASPPTTGDCNDAANLTGVTTYALGFPNLMGRTSGPTSPLDAQMQKLSRGLRLRGLRFCFEVSAPIDTTAQIPYSYCMAFRAAWAVFTLDPITQAPLELPRFNLFTISENDKADLLWRHMFTVNFTGNDGESGPFIDTALKCEYAQHARWFNIRTRRNLREDQQLYFVLQNSNQFVLNIAMSWNLELFGFAAVKNWI